MWLATSARSPNCTGSANFGLGISKVYQGSLWVKLRSIIPHVQLRAFMFDTGLRTIPEYLFNLLLLALPRAVLIVTSKDTDHRCLGVWDCVDNFGNGVDDRVLLAIQEKVFVKRQRSNVNPNSLVVSVHSMA
jgi:hypothetical protein